MPNGTVKCEYPAIAAIDLAICAYIVHSGSMNLSLKPLLLTSLAMVAFAANSVIARQALLAPEIGPWSYTSARLLSGALVLALLVGPVKSWKAGSWIGALYLLIYAGFFSLAYVSLPSGIGALILFAAVQMTMISNGLLNGVRSQLVVATHTIN